MIKIFMFRYLLIVFTSYKTNLDSQNYVKWAQWAYDSKHHHIMHETYHKQYNLILSDMHMKLKML